jgi:hypothetical protein
MASLRTEETRKALQDIFKGVKEFHVTGSSDNNGGMFIGELYGEERGVDNRSQIWVTAKKIDVYVGKNTPIYNAVASAWESMQYDRTSCPVAIYESNSKHSKTREDAYELHSVDAVRTLFTYAGVVIPPKASKSRSKSKNKTQAEAV